jgi:hypothetical protein
VFLFVAFLTTFFLGQDGLTDLLLLIAGILGSSTTWLIVIAVLLVGIAARLKIKK